jgi:S-adenosylmethionine:tRNA ribosyltransferase-isomerase
LSKYLKDYNFAFPDKLIAKYPKDKRDTSRLLVLDRATNIIKHKEFTDIIDYFSAGDVLVLNDSKVFPCRLITQRKTGGRQEILLVRKIETSESAGEETWQVMLNANRKVKKGDVFEFEGLTLTLINEGGPERLARLQYEGDLFSVLDKIADMPLPPYIQRGTEPLDKNRYQTVYANPVGSVAAPTAGFHFTDELLAQLKAKGVIVTYVTLHVGLGTFLPVRSEDVTQHDMHEEFYSLTEETCNAINDAKIAGHKVFAVGTTATRVLESAAEKELPLKPESSSTKLFIYPPHEFKLIDHLITNFHQPESTLIMLVSAFASREVLLNTYQEAVSKEYRLFSYGDSMLIL